MLRIGAVSAFISVALGAFGAHALKETLDAYRLGVFQTGVHYQFFHAIAMCLVGLTPRPSKPAFYAFLAGSVIFSGSLYALALTGARFWGAITPLGGLSFLIGWALFALSAKST